MLLAMLLSALGAWVDPMIGTEATGHTFPGPCRPFGLVQPSPDTGNGNWDHCSGYVGTDRRIHRFSQTHLNGTGNTSLGDVALMPFVGDATGETDFSAAFEKRDEHAELGLYRVTLANGIRVEIAAGVRLARYRIAFPANRPAGLLLDFPYGLYREASGLRLLSRECRVEKVSDSRLCGRTVSDVWATRRIYSVVDFSRAADSLEVLRGGKGPRYVARFAPGSTVEVAVALSSRSAEGAGRNFDAECARTFDELVAETKAAWEDYLVRLPCPFDDEAGRRSFYTALYHLCIQPNLISDVGEVPRYSTFSLWDTFRSAHPLYERLVPELVPAFVNSLLAHYDEYGFLPRWELWGRETNCMIGNHAVPVVVDACLHGFSGIDVEKAYAAVKATLTTDGREKFGVGVYPPRIDWDVYDRFGYYPFDLIARESVSRTLECSYDDARAAALARHLGKDADAAFFERRSWNFTNLFDRTTLCFRGKDSRGNWREPFVPARAHADPDFTEGSALQYSWHVLHRPEWLVGAMGGKAAFEARLDAFFAGSLYPGVPRKFNHDITGLIGDYSHGNEPCHHVPGLYRLVDRPDKEAAVRRKIERELYRPAPDGLCGNDDCGQMSAWYLRSVTEGTDRGLVVGAEQASSRVVAFDGLRPGPSSVVWAWSPAEDPGVRAADRRFFDCMAECKPLGEGDAQTLLVVGSAGAFAEVSVKTARALAYGVVDLSPHSIAKLPGERAYVVASAISNCLTVVDASKAPLDPSKQVSRKYPLLDAHGVEWDARRQCLWALGRTNLVAYAWRQGTLVETRSYDIRPVGGHAGHDLIPDGTGRYLVTTGGSLMRFDPDAGAFELLRREKELKSVSPSTDRGLLIGKTREVWWTDRAIVERGGVRYEVGPFPGTKFYKFRWLKR